MDTMDQQQTRSSLAAGYIRFTDRRDAGRQLAVAVRDAIRERENEVVVLAMPRGGVPVAAEVATALRAPLHLVMVRKLGVPDQPELALGAIGEGGARYVDGGLARRFGVTPAALAVVEQRERLELERRERRYGDSARRPSLKGKVAVVVDDGIATGATARAACRAARGLGASTVVLAVPAAPSNWRQSLVGEADVLVAVGEADVPAVGFWYDDFGQVSDDDVVRLLGA
jgi:putative phosphoribosyl transferase